MLEELSRTRQYVGHDPRMPWWYKLQGRGVPAMLLLHPYEGKETITMRAHAINAGYHACWNHMHDEACL